jgi:hypothetical protein
VNKLTGDVTVDSRELELSAGSGITEESKLCFITDHLLGSNNSPFCLSVQQEAPANVSNLASVNRLKGAVTVNCKEFSGGPLHCWRI